MQQHSHKQFKVYPSLHASSGKRFANYLIDYIIQIAIVFSLSIGIGFFCEFTGSYSICESWDNFNGIEEYLLGIVILFFYYSAFEIYFAQSPGKFLTQTIVVDEFGNKPTNNQMLIRSLSRMVPFDALSFLGSTRGWHDRWADTYVVNKKELEKEKEDFYSLEEIGRGEQY